MAHSYAGRGGGCNVVFCVGLDGRLGCFTAAQRQRCSDTCRGAASTALATQLPGAAHGTERAWPPSAPRRAKSSSRSASYPSQRRAAQRPGNPYHSTSFPLCNSLLTSRRCAVLSRDEVLPSYIIPTRRVSGKSGIIYHERISSCTDI
jgi:hypothetical protein